MTQVIDYAVIMNPWGRHANSTTEWDAVADLQGRRLLIKLHPPRSRRSLPARRHEVCQRHLGHRFINSRGRRIAL